MLRIEYIFHSFLYYQTCIFFLFYLKLEYTCTICRVIRFRSHYYMVRTLISKQCLSHVTCKIVYNIYIRYLMIFLLLKIYWFVFFCKIYTYIKKQCFIGVTSP